MYTCACEIHRTAPMLLVSYHLLIMYLLLQSLETYPSIFHI